MKKILFLVLICSCLYCENVIVSEEYKYLYKEKYREENQQLYCIYVINSSDKKLYAIYNLQKIENFYKNQILTPNTIVGESSSVKVEEVGGI